VGYGDPRQLLVVQHSEAVAHVPDVVVTELHHCSRASSCYSFHMKDMVKIGNNEADGQVVTAF
jgi:hypothetical protein